METCYTNLANAIILLAVKDYRRALRRLKKFPGDKDAIIRKLECEQFFCSGCFEVLTSMEGEVLLRKLYQAVYGE